MTIRWQLPVYSPVGPDTLVAGAWAALNRCGAARAEQQLQARLGGKAAVLTDSGTSALVLALRALVPPGGTVALPAWGCIDITAAAVLAGVRVRLYDISPDTLSHDPDSLEHTLQRGVDAVVVAHFHGYPADVVGVRALAARHGVAVIEDAAQRAGATLHGASLGSLGDVAVLSFGRGKGTSGGGGGALIANGAGAAARVAAMRESLVRSRGLGPLLSTAAQWVLGHPAVYGLPASLPMLQLGEMVYHAAHEPAALADAAAAMVLRSLERELEELGTRRARAVRLRSRIMENRTLIPAEPIAGADPGYLRFVLRADRGRVRPVPQLGIMPGYPMTLDEHHPIRPLLLPGEHAGAGARALRDTVLTLPTHSRVSEADIARLERWLRSARGSVVHATGPVAHA